jgi:hypothetical protein
MELVIFFIKESEKTESKSPLAPFKMVWICSRELINSIKLTNRSSSRFTPLPTLSELCFLKYLSLFLWMYVLPFSFLSIFIVIFVYLFFLGSHSKQSTPTPTPTTTNHNSNNNCTKHK